MFIPSILIVVVISSYSRRKYGGVMVASRQCYLIRSKTNATGCIPTWSSLAGVCVFVSVHVSFHPNMILSSVCVCLSPCMWFFTPTWSSLAGVCVCTCVVVSVHVSFHPNMILPSRCVCVCVCVFASVHVSFHPNILSSGGVCVHVCVCLCACVFPSQHDSL